MGSHRPGKGTGFTWLLGGDAWSLWGKAGNQESQEEAVVVT